MLKNILLESLMFTNNGRGMTIVLSLIDENENDVILEFRKSVNGIHSLRIDKLDIPNCYVPIDNIDNNKQIVKFTDGILNGCTGIFNSNDGELYIDYDNHTNDNTVRVMENVVYISLGNALISQYFYDEERIHLDACIIDNSNNNTAFCCVRC